MLLPRTAPLALALCLLPAACLNPLHTSTSDASRDAAPPPPGADASVAPPDAGASAGDATAPDATDATDATDGDAPLPGDDATDVTDGSPPFDGAADEGAADLGWDGEAGGPG